MTYYAIALVVVGVAGFVAGVLVHRKNGKKAEAAYKSTIEFLQAELDLLKSK